MLPFTVNARMVLDGMAGGDVEYAPCVSHYATYGPYRYERLQAVTAVANATDDYTFELTGYGISAEPEDLTGNEFLVIHVRTKTQYSEIPELDRVRYGNVDLDLRSGHAIVPLARVIDSLTRNRPLAITLVERSLQSELFASSVREMRLSGLDMTSGGGALDSVHRRTVVVSTKGTLTLTFDASDVARKALLMHARTLSKRVRESGMRGKSLVFGSEAFNALLAKDTRIREQAYAAVFGNDRGARFPALPKTRVRDLRLIHDESEFGTRQAADFFLPMPDSSAWGAAYKRFVFNALAADRHMRAVILRLGVSEAAICEAVRAQHAQSGDSLAISDTYLLACRALVAFGTSVAIATEYTADIRAVKVAVDTDAPAATSGPNRQKWSRRLVGVESFDRDALGGMARSADCEDSALVALVAIDELSAIGRDVGDDRMLDDFPLLDCMRKILARYVAFGAGTLVTSAYPRTAMGDGVPDVLPIKYSAEDMQATIGGHSHGLLIPRGAVADMLARGNQVSKADVAAVRGNPAAWEVNLPALFVEGTAPVSALMLPAVEYGPAYRAECVAVYKLRAAFVRHCPVTCAVVRTAGMPHVIDAQSPDRREFTFYREAVHLLSPQLKRINARMAHVCAIDVPSQSRGVDMGRLLRMSDTVGLGYHMASVSNEDMTNVVKPVSATLENMFPAHILFRTVRTKDELPPINAALPHVVTLISRLNQFVPKDVVLGLADRTGMFAEGLDAYMEKHSRASPDTQTQGIIDAHLDKPGRAVCCLVTQAWAIANAGPEKFCAELDAMVARRAESGALGYFFTMERPLPQCLAIIYVHVYVETTPAVDEA